MERNRCKEMLSELNQQAAEISEVKEKLEAKTRQEVRQCVNDIISENQTSSKGTYHSAGRFGEVIL